MKTPWQKVHEKFGTSSAGLARMLGRHRSKVSRAIKDQKGLISGKDQELILSVAAKERVKITPDDLTAGAVVMERPPMSFRQQAELIGHLADRCTMADGSIASESYLTIEAGDAADLRHLAARLRRMAPYESKIRELVMRK